ncbi:MAG: hypothetical protein ACI9Y1_001738 [Lentisphaeria bacterium]
MVALTGSQNTTINPYGATFEKSVLIWALVGRVLTLGNKTPMYK